METDANKLPSLPTTPKKKSFYFEEEDIYVKPSPELIPDEYEHSDNKGVLFHVFRNQQEQDLADSLLKSMKGIDYSVDEKNLHDLNVASEFRACLDTIRKEAAKKSALLLVFIGYYGKGNGTLRLLEEPPESQTVHVKEVWNFFATNNCPELKYKPKIFIFCTSPKPKRVLVDAMLSRSMNYDQVYDFPAESDMLIVYKKIEDPWSSSKIDYIHQLSANIRTFSKKHDIIDLVSYFHNQKVAPVVISTLTRKFYLTPSEEREHFFAFEENRNELEKVLVKIHDDVQQLHDLQRKKKEKKEKKFFSFRKKSDEKPKVVKKAEKDVVVPPKTPKPTNRTSVGSATDGRSRRVSESDYGKKPGWKY